MSANVTTSQHLMLVPAATEGSAFSAGLEAWLGRLSGAGHAGAHLAALDERLLIDVGYALDEIPRVRQGEVFTPRALERR